QPLVTGAEAGAVVVGGDGLAEVQGVRDSGVDVRGPTADGHGHAAGMTVETGVRGVVADAGDEAAHDSGDIGVGRGVDFTGDVHEAGGHHGLHGHLGVGVLPQQVVEHRITDLVADL